MVREPSFEPNWTQLSSWINMLKTAAVKQTPHSTFYRIIAYLETDFFVNCVLLNSKPPGPHFPVNNLRLET